MRIDRRAGAISSACGYDFDRVCLFKLDPPELFASTTDASLSESDPDDIPEEEEFDDNALVVLEAPRRPVEFLVPGKSASAEATPRACAVEAPPPLLRTIEKG